MTFDTHLTLLKHIQHSDDETVAAFRTVSAAVTRLEQQTVQVHFWLPKTEQVDEGTCIYSYSHVTTLNRRFARVVLSMRLLVRTVCRPY